MASTLDLFKTKALASHPLFEQLNKELGDKFGSTGGNFPPRLSIKGGRFRQIVNGEQTRVSPDLMMNVIIVDAAEVGRQYYEGEYDEKADKSAPRCWSLNRDTPAPDVENPMSATCVTCPHNVRTETKGRDCRYHQRLAIVIEGDMDTVHQLQLPATSIFGDAKNGHMPLQAYGRLLKQHGIPICTLVTTMYFDADAPTPKLFFKPVRELTPAELDAVVALRASEAVKQAITFSPAKMDGAETTESLQLAAPEPQVKRAEEQPKPKRGRPVTKAAPARTAVVEDEPEPVKVQSKPAPKATTVATAEPEPDALAAIMEGWDLEDSGDSDVDE